MNTIIPNYYFYLIDLMNGLRDFLIIIIIFAIILCCVFTIIALITEIENNTVYTWNINKAEKNKSEKYIQCLYSKYIKRSIVVTLIATFLLVVIPSKETMQYMMINSFVTEENVNTVLDTVKDATDYVFEKIK